LLAIFRSETGAPQGHKNVGTLDFYPQVRVDHLFLPRADLRPTLRCRLASVAILTRAAECIDRIAAARVSIAKDGAIIENQYGVAKMNPACVLEKAARDGFFAAMRLLGIDMSAGITHDPLPWTG
jgi:hypothetical protein